MDYLQVIPPGRPRHLFEQHSASDVHEASSGRHALPQSLSFVESQALGQQPSPSWQAGSSYVQPSAASQLSMVHASPSSQLTGS